MNRLKLVTLAAIIVGVAGGSSMGQGAPAADGKPLPVVEQIDHVSAPEMLVGSSIAAAGRLVVASSDSGYRPVASGGGASRKL